MNDHERLLLLHKKWIGSISPEEINLLEEQLSSDESFRKEAKWLEKLWDKAAQMEPSFQPDTSKAWDKFRKRMHAPARSVRIVRMPRIWSVAAAMAIMVSLFAIVNLFLPIGRSGMQTVKSEKNSCRTLTLSDGSFVVMNSSSRLRFPNVFSDTGRVVELTGEAYFQVKADPSHPFIIQTPHGIVHVTGTEFNVRAYGKEKFEEVYVQSGKVAFRSRDKDEGYKLAPREKARLEKAAKSMEVVALAPDAPLVWNNYHLNFKDTPLRDILAVLGEYFQVQFKTDKAPKILDCTFTAHFAGLDLDETRLLITKLTKAAVKPVTGRTVFSLSGGGPCK